MPQFPIDAAGCTWVQYWMQKRYCLRTKGSSWILYCPSVFSLFVRFVVVLGAFLVLFVCRFCFVLFCFGFWFSLPVLALTGVGGLAALSLLVLWGGLLPFRVLLCSLGPFVLGRGLGCLCWFLFLVLFVSWLFGSCFLVLFLVLVDSLYFFCVPLHSHLVSRLSKWTSGR